MRIKNIFLVCIWQLVLILPLGAQDLIKGPYLIYPDDNTKMTVLYERTSKLTLYYRKAGTTTFSSFSTGSQISNGNLRICKLTGLVDGTEYEYKLGSSGSIHTFYTAPGTGLPNISFYAYGDTRGPNQTSPEKVGAPAQNVICGQMLNEITKDPASQTFLLHAGDWVHKGGTESSWGTEFFNRSYSNNLEIQSKLPLMGAFGNHDDDVSGGGEDDQYFEKFFPYNFIGSYGGKDQRFVYSFDYGPVHVAVMDQYVDWDNGDAQQFNWLDNDLSNTDRFWKIVLFHEPGYTAGNHPGTGQPKVRTLIQSICESHNARFVIAGHNHCYVRAVENDIHHLTLGGGGAPLTSPDNPDSNVETSEETLHFAKFTIKGTEMILEVIDDNGLNVEPTTVSVCNNFPETADLLLDNEYWLETQGYNNLGVYYTSGTITTALDTDVRVRSGKSVGFVSGQEVTLQRGFRAEAGSRFQAIGYSCGGSNFKSAETKESFGDNKQKEKEGLLHDNLQVNVYPNPTNGLLTISISGNEGISKAKIYNSMGQLVKDEIFTSSVNVIDLTGMAKGLYFVKVETMGKLVSKTIKLE